MKPSRLGWGTTRNSGNAQPAVFNRQIAMYLAKPVGGWSTTRIGKFYNDRHLSTVCYALKRIQALREAHPDIDALLTNLTDQIRSAPVRPSNLRTAPDIASDCAHSGAHSTTIFWILWRTVSLKNCVHAPWKEGPGTVKIRQDQRKIDILTKRYFSHTFQVFLEKSSVGPAGLARYVDGLVSTRNYGLNAVQQVFAEASSINEGIAGEARRTIQTLSKIKLGSALVLTGVGCVVTLGGGSAVLAAQIGLVKLGADVTGEIIKPQDHVGDNVKGIAYQVGNGADQGADKMAEHAEEIARHGVGKYGSKLASAQVRIQHYSEELARRFRSRKAIKIGRRLENAKSDATIAQRALSNSSRALKTAKVAGKAVPLVFAAWDVIDAWHEYEEDVGASD